MSVVVVGQLVLGEEPHVARRASVMVTLVNFVLQPKYAHKLYTISFYLNRIIFPAIAKKMLLVSLGDRVNCRPNNKSDKRNGIGRCPIFYRTPCFSAKTHAALVTNVVNALKPFGIHI